jgi:starch-binding outer membrane protein, SusD/RagB family
MPNYDVAPAHSGAASAQAPRGRSIRMTLTALASMLATAVACNPGAVLRVPQPDNVPASGINSAAELPVLEAGTQSAFQVAYSGAADEGNGGHEGYINWSGIFTDEMSDEETFPTRIVVDDRIATASNASLKGYFIDLTSARAIADKADVEYNAFGADSAGHGVVLALGGYTYIMFAELYCEGVPVSTLNNNGSITYGQPLTRQQLLTIAVERFDSAITVASANHDSSTLNLARIGLGRALLDSNDDADAATAVAAVPVSFAYDIGASTNSAIQNNGVWNYTFNELGFSVSDSEGVNGLPFLSAADPRVPAINTGGNGVSGIGPFIQQQLYISQTAPIPLATGIEAGLITAEHQLRTGGPGGPYFATLNALRATFPGLTPIAAAPATADGAQRLLFHERAFWMYLTGHREGDLRRLVRQYGRPVNTVYPIGTAINGVPYGTATVFAISEDEANNPNFHGCLNTNP